MNWYVTIKRYYMAGYYTTDQVQIFVTAKKITTEQAIEIIGDSATYRRFYFALVSVTRAVLFITLEGGCYMTIVGVNSGGGDAEAAPIEHRLEDVENRLVVIQDEIFRFGTENLSFSNELLILKEKQSRHEEDVKQIKQSTVEMKIQFNEIMRRWDTLDSRVFQLLQQSQTDSKSERKVFIDLLKYVLAGTIFAIIAFLFKGGV